MTDIERRAEEALHTLEELEQQAREDARQASQPEPGPEQVVADRLADARSHWVHFDWGSAA
jgi:hypothetical protein